ncbi:MAG: MBL fold metallo-hydrolase, partial [Deltaproteobacteria bacterium]|nr:MBL fold metallo-hydrolase [Deltaproteobacteria bacterium]
MAHPSQIGPGIFMVAGPDLTDPRDALAYLIQDGKELALIDAGAGPSYSAIIDQIRLAGQAPDHLRMIIVTHAHIDHIGALADFVRDYSVSIVAHAEDCQALEAADPVLTVAKSYGLDLKPVEVTVKLEGRINRL